MDNTKEGKELLDFREDPKTATNLSADGGGE